MIRFDYDGKHFNAGKGWLVVYRGGKEILKAFDVFKKEPTKEEVIEFYKFMSREIIKEND
ncbi:MAG: hypothetical protein J6S85_12690 [Methanobrevibacter sp.]|nr:hypothetical protein [Methanobrevibacter sp.]